MSNDNLVFVDSKRVPVVVTVVKARDTNVTRGTNNVFTRHICVLTRFNV